jgi:hypothetical protein
MVRRGWRIRPAVWGLCALAGAAVYVALGRTVWLLYAS